MNTLNEILANKGKNVLILGVIVIIFLILGSGGLFVWQKLQKGPSSPASSLKVGVELKENKTSELINKVSGDMDLKDDVLEFKLSFPKQSVIENQQISIQQIRSISGLGSGVEFVAGVDLSPSGTSLMVPAELSIKVDSANKNLMAFSYEEDGRDFHLVPVFFENGRATIFVNNFSGYGIINVGDGTYTPPPPESIEAQAQQSIAKIIFKVQERQRSGDPRSITDEEQEEIYQFLNMWYKNSVRPDLMAAVDNENLIEPAINQFNRWRAAIQIVARRLGFEEARFNEEIEFSLNQAAKAVANAYVKASKKCTADKDATQIAKMTKWAIFARYWDLNGRSGLDVDDLIDLTKKCANFELRISSKIESPKTGEVMTASGRLLIGLDNDMYLVGGGEIKEDSRTVKDFACNYPEGIPVHPVEIIASKLDTGKGGQRVNLILQFADGEDQQFNCVSTVMKDYTTSNVGIDWLGGYLLIYHGESYIPTGKFEISDWKIVNAGGVYAKKVVNRTKTISVFGISGPLIENTTYELIHTPK